MKDFHTNDEAFAFNDHLEERGLEDTEANRATWFAARDYFTRDRNADKIEASEATISASDVRFREMALSLATQGAAGETPSSTVARAEAFLSFLTDQPSVPSTKENDRGE